MAKEDLHILPKITMKEVGSKAELKDMESMSNKMGIFTKAIGKMMSLTAMERKWL
jgi:hypothetical protein